MSQIKFQISRFLRLSGLIFIILFVFVVFTIKVILGAYITSRQVDESILQNSTPHLNKDDLDKSINFLKNKKFIPLDLKQ